MRGWLGAVAVGNAHSGWAFNRSCRATLERSREMLTHRLRQTERHPICLETRGAAEREPKGKRRRPPYASTEPPDK
jgi:hypothetical protein